MHVLILGYRLLTLFHGSICIYGARVREEAEVQESDNIIPKLPDKRFNDQADLAHAIQAAIVSQIVNVSNQVFAFILLIIPTFIKYIHNTYIPVYVRTNAAIY
jgi:hypothetical protein